MITGTHGTFRQAGVIRLRLSTWTLCEDILSGFLEEEPLVTLTDHQHHDDGPPLRVCLFDGEALILDKLFWADMDLYRGAYGKTGVGVQLIPSRITDQSAWPLPSARHDPNSQCEIDLPGHLADEFSKPE